MIPKVNRWIKGVWDDPEGPITYDVLHARQSAFTGRGRRLPDSFKLTRLTTKTNGNKFFIGYCHGEHLLYYDVCTPDGQWTRYAADGISMLDVPQYSIDEEWIFTRSCAYNAFFTGGQRQIILGKNSHEWQIMRPVDVASMIPSLERTREGLETTGFSFSIRQGFTLNNFRNGMREALRDDNYLYYTKPEVAKLVIEANLPFLYDYERLGFVVDQFRNRDTDNIPCTTVDECLDYLIAKADIEIIDPDDPVRFRDADYGSADVADTDAIVDKFTEMEYDGYHIEMKKEITKSRLTWMRDRKAARGDNRKAMGDLSVLPNDVLDKIFAGLLLH